MLHDSPQLTVLGEAILSAENSGNLWAVKALARTLLGSSQRSPDPLAGVEGVAAPPQEPTPVLGLRLFGLGPQ